MRPLHRSEGVRNEGVLIARTVHDHGHQEGLLLSDVVGAIDRQLPFAAEIALQPRLGMLGDHRDKQSAIVDLVPDLLIPCIPATQLALIEKDRDTGGAQRLADLMGGVRILGCIA